MVTVYRFHRYDIVSDKLQMLQRMGARDAIEQLACATVIDLLMRDRGKHPFGER